MNEILFENVSEYEAFLNRGLRISGENKDYFARGRVSDLKKQLPRDFCPRRILDFGCGIGQTAQLLSSEFPDADVMGVDSSEASIRYATEHFGGPRLSFYKIKQFNKIDSFDLCYMNGVFHHIAYQDRMHALRFIYRTLRSAGYFAFFENNPWNLGTQIVMKCIPFDRHARMLAPRRSRQLLETASFSCAPTRYLFYFPRWLVSLRPFEERLAYFPLGAQYFILARKK